MKHRIFALITLASAMAIAACSSLTAGANNDPLALFAQIQTKIQCDVNGVDIGPPNLFNVINFLSQVANNSLVMTCRSRPQPAILAPVAAAPASAPPVGMQAPGK